MELVIHLATTLSIWTQLLHQGEALVNHLTGRRKEEDHLEDLERPIAQLEEAHHMEVLL